MDRDTAIGLIQEYLKYGEIMARLWELSANLSPEDRRKVVDADSEACFALYDGVVKTVTKYYPDLEPPDHATKRSE